MDTVDNTVGGTIRDSRVILDRPMNWTEGTRVVVQLMPEEAGLIEGVWPADGSPDGEAEILRRMKEGARDVPTPEEAAAFEAALAEVRQWDLELTEKNKEKARQP